uniref:Protein max n=1 Tax=Glossina palpalis gambiensis TaxID=67801 RepID=A0A1B0C6U9_9MUSC
MSFVIKTNAANFSVDEFLHKNRNVSSLELLRDNLKITSFNDRFNQRRNSTQNFTQEEKRAHHNALERKRCDHIKESFTNLREAVPSLKGKKASRAQILKKTTDCIQNMRRKIQANQKDVNDLKHQIAILEEEVRLLESARNGSEIDASSYHQLINCDHSDGDEQDFSRRSKKMKTSYQT